MSLKKLNAALEELKESVDGLSYVNTLLGGMPGGSGMDRQVLDFLDDFTHA